MSNVWAQRWADVIDDGTPQVVRRLGQGRALLRSGRVTNVGISRGTITATVQGHSATPLVVEVAVPTLSDEEWDTVVEALASQVRHRARLLAGQVPDGLTSQVAAAGVALMPDRHALEVTCRCGDSVVPCVHGAAAWLAAGEEISADPFALLRVRGRGRERLLADSAAVRSAAAGASAPPGQPVASLTGDQWVHARLDIEELLAAGASPPRTVAGPLRLLGDPPGWAGGVSAGDLFAPLVQRGADWAAEQLWPGDGSAERPANLPD